MTKGGTDYGAHGYGRKTEPDQMKLMPSDAQL
jgi:hypothetical protein